MLLSKTQASNYLKIRPNSSNKIQGVFHLPGDKSCAIRSLIIPLLFSNSPVKIYNLPESEDVNAAKTAIIKLGCQLIEQKNHVTLIPAQTWQEGVINLSNSRTSLILTLALALIKKLNLTLEGDASLTSRSLKDIIELANKFGCKLKHNNWHLPVQIESGISKSPKEISLTGSAQYKTLAVLLAVFSKQKILFHEYAKSRDHTERMLELFGWRATYLNSTDFIFRKGEKNPLLEEIYLGGDPSSASFLIILAAYSNSQKLVLKNSLLNPSRLGYLNFLPLNLAVANIRKISNELIGDIIIENSPNTPASFSTCYENANFLIDEFPILAVAAVFSTGISILKLPERLKNKESDRITAICDLLAKFAVKYQLSDEYLAITGKSIKFNQKVKIENSQDHRILMAAIIMALLSNSELVLKNHQYIDISFPEFLKFLPCCYNYIDKI